MSLEQLAPEGTAGRDAITQNMLDGLHVTAGWIDENESKGEFLTGVHPCFADLALASMLLWLRLLSGTEIGSLWDKIAKVDGGRWARYSQRFEIWEVVI